jgi:selenocysteine-specific elongation factor
MMTSTSFILATAGHVDHGKSALVKALTGTDPSRLPQEKARGITIDLGFAQLALPMDGQEFSVGVIDVPGHEDFVKNMVAGVGSIDLALLVVAADDGWMPQTEEHLHILTYLGVTRAVVALTKCDLTDADAAGKALRQHLQGSIYADAPIVPTSCLTGFGLGGLRDCLTRELAKLPPPQDIGKPRLAVDRAFSLRGLGTVVTGTLTGGKLQVGDSVVVRPDGTPLRVRMIQNHHQGVEGIGPGQRAALNLPEASVQHRAGDGGLARGHVITLPDAGEPSRILDVLLTRLARLPAEAPPLRHGERLRVHHGSGSSAARVYLKNAGELLPGGSEVAQLRMETPMLIFAGDRVVLRDASARHTLAGGLVLDPEASAKGFRTEAQQQLLAARAAVPCDPAVFVASHLARHRVAQRSTLLAKSVFSSRQVEDAVNGRIAAGAVMARGDFLAEAGWWKKLVRAAAAIIDEEHRKHPNLQGLDIGRLAGALGSEGKGPKVFETLIADLCQNGFVKVRHAIQRQAHQAALPPPLQAAGARVLAALALKPFDPPSRSEVAPDLPAQQALRFFRESGQIIELNPDVVLTAEAHQKMRAMLAAFINQQGPAKVSDLRTLLGSSRRIMIPFLERCDREGFTRRNGDLRSLGSVRKV